MARVSIDGAARISLLLIHTEPRVDQPRDLLARISSNTAGCGCMTLYKGPDYLRTTKDRAGAVEGKPKHVQ